MIGAIAQRRCCTYVLYGQAVPEESVRSSQRLDTRKFMVTRASEAEGAGLDRGPASGVIVRGAMALTSLAGDIGQLLPAR